MPEGGDMPVGTHLLIPSGDLLDLGKNCITSGSSLSGAGAFGVYLRTGRTLLGEFESSGGEEGQRFGTSSW